MAKTEGEDEDGRTWTSCRRLTRSEGGRAPALSSSKKRAPRAAVMEGGSAQVAALGAEAKKGLDA